MISGVHRKNYQSTLIRVSIFSMIAIFSSTTLSGQDKNSLEDWPQWMGPERKDIWHLDIQKESLDKGDFKKIWEVPVGTGYCGPSVSNGKVYLMDYVGHTEKSERVLCFDAISGEKVWEYAYQCPYSGVGYPTGPRASVLIEDERAYSFGTMGDLHCFDAGTGKLLWHVEASKEYELGLPVWGLAASPLMEKDLLIVQLGARPDACLVAFDRMSGREVWRALSDQASYSAPIVIDQAGKRVLVCWTGDNLAGLNPGTGKVYWKIPFVRRQGIINIATPAFDSPYIFLSSFWDGSMLIKLDQENQDAALLWTRAGESERNTDALHCVISTPIIQGDHIYGVDSYGEFRCLELMTGDRIWTDDRLVPKGRWANAHFTRQGENIWAFNELGDLVLGKVSPKGFQDMGRVNLAEPVAVSPNPRGGINWSHPAYAGRYIYARSDAKLVCYELVK